jgi:type VI protein secretion system component VasF
MAEDDDFMVDDGDEETSGWVSNLDDDFDRLREASARSADAYDDMEVMDEPSERRSPLASITPAQRMILAFVFLLVVLVWGCAFLLWFNIIPA